MSTFAGWSFQRLGVCDSALTSGAIQGISAGEPTEGMLAPRDVKTLPAMRCPLRTVFAGVGVVVEITGRAVACASSGVL
jgi:hypothetical protein